MGKQNLKHGRDLGLEALEELEKREYDDKASKEKKNAAAADADASPTDFQIFKRFSSRSGFECCRCHKELESFHENRLSMNLVPASP
jgi:hypothetical protein